jgi:hypothetical protein
MRNNAMAASGAKNIQCADCGVEYPAGTQVCPACKVILVAPEVRPKTPAWLITLLVLIILGLLWYACVTGWQIFVEHQY